MDSCTRRLRRLGAIRSEDRLPRRGAHGASCPHHLADRAAQCSAFEDVDNECDRLKQQGGYAQRSITHLALLTAVELTRSGALRGAASALDEPPPWGGGYGWIMSSGRTHSSNCSGVT